LAILNDSRLAGAIPGENELSQNWEIITPTPGKKVYPGVMISMVFDGVSLPFALKFISDVSGLKIARKSGVNGKITIYTNNIPWDQSLEMVLEQNGLHFEIGGDTIYIRPENGASNVEGTGFHKNSLWIRVNDTNIFSVLEYIKKRANVEFIIDDNVSGKITVHLKNLSWERALAVVLESSKLDGLVKKLNLTQRHKVAKVTT